MSLLTDIRRLCRLTDQQESLEEKIKNFNERLRTVERERNELVDKIGGEHGEATYTINGFAVEIINEGCAEYAAFFSPIKREF